MSAESPQNTDSDTHPPQKPPEPATAKPTPPPLPSKPSNVVWHVLFRLFYVVFPPLLLLAYGINLYKQKGYHNLRSGLDPTQQTLLLHSILISFSILAYGLLVGLKVVSNPFSAVSTVFIGIGLIGLTSIIARFVHFVLGDIRLLHRNPLNKLLTPLSVIFSLGGAALGAYLALVLSNPNPASLLAISLVGFLIPWIITKLRTLYVLNQTNEQVSRSTKWELFTDTIKFSFLGQTSYDMNYRFFSRSVIVFLSLFIPLALFRQMELFARNKLSPKRTQLAVDILFRSLVIGAVVAMYYLFIQSLGNPFASLPHASLLTVLAGIWLVNFASFVGGLFAVPMKSALKLPFSGPATAIGFVWSVPLIGMTIWQITTFATKHASYDWLKLFSFFGLDTLNPTPATVIAISLLVLTIAAAPLFALQWYHTRNLPKVVNERPDSETPDCDPAFLEHVLTGAVLNDYLYSDRRLPASPNRSVGTIPEPEGDSSNGSEARGRAGMRHNPLRPQRPAMLTDSEEEDSTAELKGNNSGVEHPPLIVRRQHPYSEDQFSNRRRPGMWKEQQQSGRARVDSENDSTVELESSDNERGQLTLSPTSRSGSDGE